MGITQNLEVLGRTPPVDLTKIAEQGLGEHPMDSAILKVLHDDASQVKLEVRGNMLNIQVPDSNVDRNVPMNSTIPSSSPDVR